MEKFDSKKHKSILKDLPFSYLSLPIYLDFRAYVFKRNNEDLIVLQDLIYPHDFPSIFLPRGKDNWPHSTIVCATELDIQELRKAGVEIRVQIPTESEYFYQTENFLNPKQRIGKEIRRFDRAHKYKLLKSYPAGKVESFYKKWKSQRTRDQAEFIDVEGDQLFAFTLKGLKKYRVKQLYVEIDKKLVGLIWACSHPKGGWASLQLKTDYEYSGLAHFLRHNMAKQFAKENMFTTGTGCGDDGIRKYKSHLKPSLVTGYNYLFLGDKKK